MFREYVFTEDRKVYRAIAPLEPKLLELFWNKLLRLEFWAPGLSQNNSQRLPARSLLAKLQKGRETRESGETGEAREAREARETGETKETRGIRETR